MEYIEIFTSIKKLNNFIEKVLNKDFKCMNITCSQFKVLKELYENDRPYSMKELEKKFSVSQQTMYGIINRLTAKKLVEKVKNKDNTTQIVITSMAKKILAGTEGKINTIENNLCGSLSEEEKNEFERLITKILNSSKEEVL